MRYLLSFGAGILGGWAVTEVVDRVLSKRYAKQWHYEIPRSHRNH